MAAFQGERPASRQLVDRALALVRLTSHFGRVVARTASDQAVRLTGRGAGGAADVSAAHLSTVMGHPIRMASPIGGSDGTTSRSRLGLVSTDSAVPKTVFVKTTARTVAARLLGEFGRLAESEVLFYRHLAPDLAAGVPQCYGAQFDKRTGRFTIVLEDLADKGAAFPDTVHPMSKDEAALVIELLARVHGAFWIRIGTQQLSADRWLVTSAQDPVLPIAGRVLQMAQRRAGEKTSLPVERGDFIFQRYPEVVRAIDEGPNTLLHGDPHPGNCYFLDGAAGLLDWQTARRGHPMRDVAYFLVTGMTPADRRATEKDLLDVYREVVASEGGPALTREDLWSRYRTCAAHACVAATATAGMGGLQAEDVAYAGLDSALTALEDLETVALLQRSIDG